MPVAYTRHLKRMAVKMDRMLISTAIAKNEAVSLAWLHQQRLDFRPRLVVDGPGIELRSVLLADVAKRENECFIRRRCRGCVGKLGVVPFGRLRVFPCWCACVSRVLDNDAEP